MTDHADGDIGDTDAIDRNLIQRDIDFTAGEWLYMENEYPVYAAVMRRMAFHARTLLARVDELQAGLHTDHEYDVEKVLWRLLVANQQYILAVHEGDHNLAQVWYERLKVFQQLWRKDMPWYMQHPKWEQSSDDIVDDVTGVPIDHAWRDAAEPGERED